MPRLIDADALKEQCFKFANDVPRSAMAFAQGQINCAPTIEAEPVRHGRWENCFTQDGERAGFCSECHAIRFIDPYCPNCGAKMRGGTDE